MGFRSWNCGWHAALSLTRKRLWRHFAGSWTGERTWRGSRNLKKYEVEYIDIPSDSVTLAPPAGAVDYETFSERNPYGFADCIGARYLLFPEREPGQYTYNRGRRRPA